MVNAHGSIDADVLIEGDRIAGVGAGLSVPDRRTRIIDARGLHVLPGGIDPHVHLSPPFADDFTSGSRTALAGGVTTVGAMAFPDEGESVGAMLARYAREIAAKSSVDVVLHPFLGAPPDVESLAAIALAGRSTFKIFTIEGDFDRNFPQYIPVLQRARELALLPMIHCEDPVILREAQRRLIAQGRKSIAHYEESRPVLAEVLAVEKAIALCELTASPVYIVHLSSKRALALCEDARRRGMPVHVETRPVYLHLTAERYQGPDGPLFVSMPPIRTAEDSEALWAGLARGSIETIGSDHAPWSRREKLDPAHDITDPLAGMSNLQVMLPMLYSEGVLRGRLTLERFVQVTATNAAKLFGVYPQKGALQPGSDADVTLWDPVGSSVVSAKDAYSREDYSIYEGWKLKGSLRLTMLRGEVVCERGRVHAVPGTGRLLRRERAPAA